MNTEKVTASPIGAYEKMPHSPKTPEEILKAMQIASINYYRDATRTNCHTFIEFTGLMNEYIKICDQNLQQGIDFTKTSVHCPNEPKLRIEDWELEYINEKLKCIFPGLQLVKLEDSE